MSKIVLRTGGTQVLPGPRLVMLEAYEYLDILLQTAVAQRVGNVQMCLSTHVITCHLYFDVHDVLRFLANRSRKPEGTRQDRHKSCDQEGPLSKLLQKIYLGSRL